MTQMYAHLCYTATMTEKAAEQQQRQQQQHQH
jgi:hypothetical protein